MQIQGNCSSLDYKQGGAGEGKQQRDVLPCLGVFDTFVIHIIYKSLFFDLANENSPEGWEQYNAESYTVNESITLSRSSHFFKGEILNLACQMY